MSAQPMMMALTFGNACGSEGMRFPAADCCAAKSLLRSSMESTWFMRILLDRVGQPLSCGCRWALTCRCAQMRAGQDNSGLREGLEKASSFQQIWSVFNSCEGG